MFKFIFERKLEKIRLIDEIDKQVYSFAEMLADNGKG